MSFGALLHVGCSQIFCSSQDFRCRWPTGLLQQLWTGRPAVGLSVQQLSIQSQCLNLDFIVFPWTVDGALSDNMWLSSNGCLSLTLFTVPHQKYLSMFPAAGLVTQHVSKALIDHQFWCEWNMISMTGIQLMVRRRGCS